MHQSRGFWPFGRALAPTNRARLLCLHALVNFSINGGENAFQTSNKFSSGRPRSSFCHTEYGRCGGSLFILELFHVAGPICFLALFTRRYCGVVIA